MPPLLYHFSVCTPSFIRRIRSAASGSWAARMTQRPSSWARRRRNSMTSPVFSPSGFPVGSSAKSTVAPKHRLRTMAELCSLQDRESSLCLIFSALAPIRNHKHGCTCSFFFAIGHIIQYCGKKPLIGEPLIVVSVIQFFPEACLCDRSGLSLFCFVEHIHQRLGRMPILVFLRQSLFCPEYL